MASHPETIEPASDPAKPRSTSLAVVVPTRSRPAELRRCLETLEAVRKPLGFLVYVCDSSPSEPDRAKIRDICDRYEWVRLSTHSGTNVAAARNACAQVADAELLVNIDDDLVLEPEAIDRLLRRYEEGSGPRVVAGSVSWDGHWTTPKKMRLIGYSRNPHLGERPDFILGAFFLYPRSLALTWPWNERIDTSDDKFMGSVWRRHGVQLLFAEDARALHPELPTSTDPSRMAEAVRHQRCHIYALLFDALIANPNPLRALSYEVLGFMASAKVYFRHPRWAIPFLRSWIKGHVQLLADMGYLRRLVQKQPPPA